jgi:DNA-binding transcriptional LysR family regulator
MWGLEGLRLAEDVTFSQLRTFACAARAGSFGQAAEQLHISQPAVSEQIKMLEERLGRRLFLRRKGTTPMLTADGEEALEAVEAMLIACDSLFRRDRRKPQEKIPLHISAGPFLRDQHLRPLIPRIYRDHPEIEIEFHPAVTPREAMRSIEAGEIDLAVFTVPIHSTAPPNARPICELPFTLIAPPGTRSRLTAGDCTLNDLQYLFPVPKWTGARWARGLLRSVGLRPVREPVFIEFVDALVAMVEGGQGVGYVMAKLVSEPVAAGRLETLDVPFPPLRRVIARSPNAPRVARDVEEMLCTELAV